MFDFPKNDPDYDHAPLKPSVRKKIINMATAALKTIDKAGAMDVHLIEDEKQYFRVMVVPKKEAKPAKAAPKKNAAPGATRDWGSEKEVKGVTQDYSTSSFGKRFPHIKEFFDQATNTSELGKLKRQARKFADKNRDGWPWGPIDHFHQEKGEELRSKGASGHKQMTAAEARMDRLLRTRDSSGKATARKFR